MSGQITTVKFHQVPQRSIGGKSTVTRGDALQGKEKESFRSSVVSVSNQEGRESIRRIDRLTLGIQQLGQVIKEASLSVLKMLPGPDAFVAIKETKAQFKQAYRDIIKKLDRQHEAILMQLKKEGFSDTEIEKIRPDFDAFLKTIENVSPELLYRIVQYQETKQSISAKKSDLGAGVLNATGTTIGVAWAATAAASKATELVAESTSSTTAAAGSVLNLVAAGILIPLQLFLIGRNIAHINTSRQHIQRIATDSAALDALKGINNQSDNPLPQQSKSEDVFNHIRKGIGAAQELLDRRKTYSKYRIAGSITSTVGDTTTLVSGILTLSGIGAIVGIPLSVFGFIVSITGNIMRSITQGKEDRFTGKAASESAREKMASNASRVGINGAAKTIQDDAHLMNTYQMRVAENKLNSIINQVINDVREGKIKTQDGVLTEKEFLQQVEHRADKLINRLKKTSLLDSDLQEMKTLLQNKYLPQLFSTDSLKESASGHDQEEPVIDLDALQSKLYARLEENIHDKSMDLEVSADTTKKINKAMTKELFLLRHGYGNAAIRAAFLDINGKKKSVLTEGDIQTLREKYPHIRVIYEKIASQHLIAQLKTDTRALRNHATESFINSAHVVVIDARYPEINRAIF